MSVKPVVVTTTILKDRQDVYDFWRDWKNLPRFSRHLKSVEEILPGHTKWTAMGPRGDVTWEAKTTVDEPGKTIGWRSTGEADVENAGRVDFTDAPPGRGTEVKVSLVYSAPGGPFGVFAAKLVGMEPEQEVADSLRRFKAILECGEVPVVEGQPSNIMRGESKPGDESKLVGLR